MAPLVDMSGVNIAEEREFALKWVDETKNLPLAEEGPDDEDLVNLVNPEAITTHKQYRQLKSIVKSSKLTTQKTILNNNMIISNQKSKFLEKTTSMKNGPPQ